MASTLEKLRRATEAAEDAKEIYTIKVEERNRLIVVALDEGYEQKTVAQTARLSSPRIIVIAAESDNLQEQSLS